MSGAAARTGDLKEKREWKLYKKGGEDFDRNNIKQQGQLENTNFIRGI